MVGLQRQRARLAAVSARLVARWDARHVWADDGSRSAASRLAREANLASSTAHREVRRARQLRTMAHTAAALAHASISTDHVDLLGRANQPWRDACFADHEAALVDHCQNLRFADARRVVRYWCQHADADAAERDGHERAEQATFSAATTFDGMVHLAGLLDPIGGAIFLESLHRLEHDQYLADKNSGRTRTAGQRRAAALVEMAIRAQTAPANGLRPRPLITILVGDESFARVCELADGVSSLPAKSCPSSPTPTSNGSSSTARHGSSTSPRNAPSPARCAGRSRSATATVNTPRAATSPPPSWVGPGGLRSCERPVSPTRTTEPDVRVPGIRLSTSPCRSAHDARRLMVNGRAAWYRRPDESVVAHAAFVRYRDLGVRRTVRASTETPERSSSVIHVERWAVRHRWLERAAVWDDECQRLEDSAVSKGSAGCTRTTSAPVELRSRSRLAVSPLLSPEALSAAEVLRLLDLGSRLERSGLAGEDEIEVAAVDAGEDPWAWIARELTGG